MRGFGGTLSSVQDCESLRSLRHAESSNSNTSASNERIDDCACSMRRRLSNSWTCNRHTSCLRRISSEFCLLSTTAISSSTDDIFYPLMSDEMENLYHHRMKVVGPVTASLYKLGRCSLLVLGDVHTTAASCGWFAKGMPIDDFIALCVKQSIDAGKSFDMFLETFYVTRGQKPEDFKRFQLCVRKMIERYFAASKWGVGIRRVAQRFAALFLKKQSIPGVRFHYSDIRSEPHVRQFLMLVADVLLCPDEAGLPKALAALAAAVPDARSLSKLLHAFTTAEDFRKARPKFLKPVNSALPATGQHRIAKQIGRAHV